MSAKPGTDPRRPRERRASAFDKGQATLWLLILALGLGVGTGARVLSDARAPAPAGVGGQVTALGAVPYHAAPTQPNAGFGRVVLLPQRVYLPRARTRAS